MSSTLILDPASDSARTELSRLARLYDYENLFPDFIKKANLDEAMETASSPSVCADPRFCRYNCSSQAQTWLSALYFHEKKAAFHPTDRAQIQQRLEKFVDYFQIRPQYEALVKRAEELHKEAELSDDHYAYIWVDPQTGEKTRHVRLKSAAETLAAAEWLDQYKLSMPFKDRHTIATRILEKAASYGARIPAHLVNMLERQAGRGVCDPEDVYKMISDRAKLANDSQLRTQVENMAEAVRTTPRIVLQPDMLLKMAHVVDELDEKLGLLGRYTPLLPAPEDVLFSATFTKAASERNAVCPLTTGNVYNVNEFSKLSRDTLANVFGEDFAKEVSDGFQINAEKVAALAHTLPLPDAETFESMLRECSIHPVLTKAAYDQSQQVDWDKLADEYMG